MFFKMFVLLIFRNDLMKKECNFVVQIGSKEKWFNKIFKNMIFLMIMFEG